MNDKNFWSKYNVINLGVSMIFTILLIIFGVSYGVGFTFLGSAIGLIIFIASIIIFTIVKINKETKS